MALAVARGCRHYSAFPGATLIPAGLASLPHEVLACALLRWPMPEGFAAFRCGVMVLSDKHNQLGLVREAAHFFGVEARLGYVARVALKYDAEPEWWRSLASLFPQVAEEELPGYTRFVSETGRRGLDRGLLRVWLRTDFQMAP